MTSCPTLTEQLVIAGVRYRRCRGCLEWLPIGAFEPKRALCRECRHYEVRQRARRRRRAAGIRPWYELPRA